MPTPSISLIVPSHVLSEEVHGETVVLNLKTGNYFALNGTATKMWQLIREGNDMDRVCVDVAAAFGVELHRVQTDYRALVAELSARGLLEDSRDHR